MNRKTAGFLMAMAALLLILHANQLFPGLPLFIAGIYLMMKKGADLTTQRQHLEKNL